jgi:hypothetical protein
MKYMLARGEKPCEYDGITTEIVNGKSVVKLVPVMFRDGVIVETDLDMSGWVNTGVLIEVSAPKVGPAPQVAPVEKEIFVTSETVAAFVAPMAAEEAPEVEAEEAPEVEAEETPEPVAEEAPKHVASKPVSAKKKR